MALTSCGPSYVQSSVVASRFLENLNIPVVSYLDFNYDNGRASWKKFYLIYCIQFPLTLEDGTDSLSRKIIKQAIITPCEKSPKSPDFTLGQKPEISHHTPWLKSTNPFFSEISLTVAFETVNFTYNNTSLSYSCLYNKNYNFLFSILQRPSHDDISVISEVVTCKE